MLAIFRPPFWLTRDSIKKHSAPSASCGYISVATAYLVSKDTIPYETTIEHVNNVLSKLNDEKTLLPKVEEVMTFIQGDRNAYVKKHEKEFTDKAKIEDYISDWVSNYEISDWMLKNPNANVQFIRYAGPHPGLRLKKNHICLQNA